MKEKTRRNLKDLGATLAAYGLLILAVVIIVLLLWLAGALQPGVPGK